ncbi:hypothetical protein CapIbe_021474 [Capra ibex]
MEEELLFMSLLLLLLLLLSCISRKSTGVGCHCLGYLRPEFKNEINSFSSTVEELKGFWRECPHATGSRISWYHCRILLQNPRKIWDMVRCGEG